MFICIMFIHCVYCGYLVASERNRENQAMPGPYILGLILPVDILLHTELEKPTHFLF